MTSQTVANPPEEPQWKTSKTIKNVEKQSKNQHFSMNYSGLILLHRKSKICEVLRRAAHVNWIMLSKSEAEHDATIAS